MLQKLEADLKSTSNQLNSVKTQSSSTADQIAATRKSLDELKENNSTFGNVVDTQKKELTSLQKELASLRSQVGSSGDFEDRITSLEIAIRAIDAHRSQVNGKLERIDREIGALQQNAIGG